MLILGGMIAGATLLLIGISYIEDIYSAKGSRTYDLTVKLSRKQLAQFYWVNPNKWRYDTVQKRGYTTRRTNHKFLLYNGGCQLIRVDLPLFDKIWFFFARHSRKSSVGTRGMGALLKSVQEDIDAMREVSQAQIREATEQMRNSITLKTSRE